ncbi:non-ribosomal peptide synthetase module [Paenibacillus pasadenensis]|uniref:non-ribosomal peptide synthetase module n=1 Tax=Paenibacillus pasadenensis TaxID=217090 RepID=UPI002040CCDA|nr:non-ribosomal peptide synthetase module [Paenibacillus pasadenensis]MCM3746735.1 non-ribosomal peptide synthetase module [Paenibacillus pasadenensis]
MAQRIATEYVHAKLQLTRDEMTRFFRFIKEQQVRFSVMVLENGSQEAVLEDNAGREKVRFVFQQEDGQFICEWSCRITQPALTNVMRKVVSAFKGDAVVNRIYSHYTMTYHYQAGAVQRITEQNDAGSRVVYQFKDTLGEMERTFRMNTVENEIDWLKRAVNRLLDQRIAAGTDEDKQKIDLQLSEMSSRLFALEA